MNVSSSHRHGYSLIELLIVIVVGTAILGVLGAIVSRMIATNSTAGEHLRDVTTLGALGEQFRRDARNTAGVEVLGPDSKSPTLRLTQTDGSLVEYQIEDEHLRRTHTAAGQPTRREVYAMDSLRVVGCKDTSATNREIALTIGRTHRPPSGDAQGGKQFDLVGVIGNAGDPGSVSEGQAGGERT